MGLKNRVRVKKLEREIFLRQDAMTFLRDGLNADSRGMMRGPQTLEMEENLFLPLRDIPKVAQDYAILEKDVLVQKALMQLLLQQEAESLIESRNNTATVQVLDSAIPPEIKARPQRVLIVFVAGVLSLFASISYTLGAVYVRNLRQRWLAERAGVIRWAFKCALCAERSMHYLMRDQSECWYGFTRRLGRNGRVIPAGGLLSQRGLYRYSAGYEALRPLRLALKQV